MSEIKLLKISDLSRDMTETHFYANTISNHLQTNHSRIESQHKHNFYAVFLFTAGSGFHEIDFNVYEVKPGAVFFLYPGQTHRWELSEDAEGYLFFHSKEFYETETASNLLHDYAFFESNQTEKCFYLKGEEIDLVRNILQNLLDEYQNTRWKKKQIIVSYLTQLYISLHRYAEQNSSIDFKALRQYQSIFTKFESLVDCYFSTRKGASEYAGLLHISQKHLNRVVRSVTGKTTTQVITERSLLEAKRQLIFTHKSISEIASDLQFDDVSYFNKLFKKYTNETPGEFLKRNKNER